MRTASAKLSDIPAKRHRKMLAIALPLMTSVEFVRSLSRATLSTAEPDELQAQDKLILQLHAIAAGAELRQRLKHLANKCSARDLLGAHGHALYEKLRESRLKDDPGTRGHFAKKVRDKLVAHQDDMAGTLTIDLLCAAKEPPEIFAIVEDDHQSHSRCTWVEDSILIYLTSISDGSDVIDTLKELLADNFELCRDANQLLYAMLDEAGLEVVGDAPERIKGASPNRE
ncbi:MAG: hypothetical protein AAF138_04250 [Planctomycetota bacterium]